MQQKNRSIVKVVGGVATTTQGLARDIPPAAQRLKDARQAAGLTQVELAEKCGVSEPVIRQWEYGRREPKAEAYLAALAACGINLTKPRKRLGVT